MTLIKCTTINSLHKDLTFMGITKWDGSALILDKESMAFFKSDFYCVPVFGVFTTLFYYPSIIFTLISLIPTIILVSLDS